MNWVKFTAKYLRVTKLTFASSNYDVIAMIFEYFFNPVYLVKVLTVGYKGDRLVPLYEICCTFVCYDVKADVIKRAYHHDLLAKTINRNGVADVEQYVCR